MSSLLFALLAVCSIVCSSQASPMKKPTDAEEYRLRIQESGEVFSEMLTIDGKEQTELFKVPAHGNIEKSNIMFDFKMNATMIHFPLKGLCFLLPLTRSQPTPRNLAANLHQITSDEVMTQKETVRIGEEITDRSILSDSLTRLCSKSRIFRVTQIPSGVEVTNAYNPTPRRIRRGYDHKCEDSLGMLEAFNTCQNKFLEGKATKCKLEYLSCAWIVNCPNLKGMVFKKLMSAERYVGNSIDCVPKHLEYYITCCGYYCD